MKTLTTLTAAIALTAGVAAATAQNAAPEAAQEAAPAISMKQAIDIAGNAVPGTLTSIALEDFDDTARYVVTLDSETSESFLVIDGANGEVIFTETVTAKSPEVLDDYIGDADVEDIFEMLEDAGFEEGDALPWSLAFMIAEMEGVDDLEDMDDAFDAMCDEDFPEDLDDAEMTAPETAGSEEAAAETAPQTAQ